MRELVGHGVSQRQLERDTGITRTFIRQVASCYTPILEHHLQRPSNEIKKIIPLDDLWVTANFKETQLKYMKAGQRSDIDVDANGRTYKGHVDSIAGASGARFSLLPPENATGNYVKVVQRIPVKIVLEPDQNKAHELRPGMSVVPKVWIK